MVDRAAAMAELQVSILSPLDQTCLAGIVLNLLAGLVTFYLWRRDAAERYLVYWSAAYCCSALRWMLTWPAVAAGSVTAQALAGSIASLGVILNLLGAYSLLQPRRFSPAMAAAALTLLFGAAVAIGLATANVTRVLMPLAVLSWGVGAVLFWMAHRQRPLSAYRIAAGAMAFNFVLFAAGIAAMGRAFAISILLPLSAMPTLVAFFIIAHQRALAKARDSEETLNTLFDTVPIPIVISIPPGGAVDRINHRALEIFGAPASAYLGKSGVQSGVVADLDIRTWIYAELAAGRDVRNREMTYLTADGTPLPVSVNASRVELRGGTRYVFTLYDLSDFRRVEGALQELNASLEQQVSERTRDLEAFSYSVSHDLRAPLRAIDGYSKLLDEEAGDRLTGPARDFLARIRANCRRMNDLIDAMLSLSQHGTATLEPALVDISAMAGQLLDDMRHAEPQRQVDVVIEPWMRATADPAAVRIVLDNLLRNAWKYTSKLAQAKIEIGCDSAGGERVYRVRDNGAGFEMAHAGDLFKPFRRLHSASEFEGSGVGLATVARVIRNLGGRIEGEGKPGAGAVFRFTLEPAQGARQGTRGAAA